MSAASGRGLAGSAIQNVEFKNALKRGGGGGCGLKFCSRDIIMNILTS